MATIKVNHKERHGSGRKKGRRLIFASVIIGTIIALAALLTVLPEVPPFKQHILTVVNRQAASLLSCKVSIGAITLDIPKGVVAKKITLSDSNDSRSLSVERIAARIDLKSLMRRRLEVRSITITGLNGTLLKTRCRLFAGPVDIGRLAARRSKTPGNNVVTTKPFVRLVTMENSAVSYIDSVTGIVASETVQSARLEFIRPDSMSFVMHAGVGYFSSSVWSGGVRSFDAQGAIGPASLLFRNAKLQGDSVLLSVIGIIPFSMEKPWDLSADARTFVAGFKNVYKTIPSFKSVGTLNATAAFTGTIVRPVLKVAVTGYGMRVGPMATDSLSLLAQYSSDHLSGKTRVWSPQGRAEASVQAGLRRLFLSPAFGRYTIAASAGNIDVRHFIGTSPRWRRTMFPVNARVYAAGSGLRRLPDTMSADLRERTGTAAESPITATAHLAGNRWDLTAAMKPGFEISGNGRYTDPQALSGLVHIQANSITRIVSVFSKENSSGSLIADAEVGGTLKKPDVSATIRAGRCTYGPYSADTVSVQCRYAGQCVGWQSLIVKRDTSAMQSAGMVSWSKAGVSLNADGKFTLAYHAAGTFSAKMRFSKGPVEGSIAAVDVNPAVLSPWFPKMRNFQGALSVQGTITGASENPAIVMRFSFDHTLSSWPVMTATGEIALADSIATATMNVRQKRSDIPLAITARIPVALQKLSRGATALRDGAVVTLRGDSVAYGSLINAFAPSVQSTGTITIRGNAIKTNGVWALSGSTHIVNKELTVKGERIKAGPAVLDLHLAGPPMRPAARFTLSGGSIKYRGNLITAYSGGGSITGKAITLDTLHISVPGGGAELSARMPIPLKNRFSFDQNSRISAALIAMPFSIIQPFMPDVVSINKGVMSGRVVIEGIAGGVPRATGTLSLQNGELYLYDCDKPLGPLNVDIDFKNDRMSLRRLAAKWGGGRIEGNGWAVLGPKGVSVAQSEIKLRDVHLNGCYENLDLGIQTGYVKVTKDSLVTIKADAILADTRFTQDYSLVEIGDRIKRKTPHMRRRPNPMFDNVTMRIAVNLNNNLTFDSNLGRMLVDGKLKIEGRPDKPAITGQFQIVDGFVYYLDRKFTITQGSIRQYDPLTINPSLNFTATSAVSWYPPAGGKEEYDITLLIKGDLANPLITLSASPSLSQPQIISLLTFGTIQTGIGSDLGSRTGTLVSQQLAGFGTRKLARFLNLESVDLYGNAFDTSSTGTGLQVAVTKQVSSRVTMTYKTGLSKSSQQMVLLSYRLLPFLYLEAETDQKARGGIDLKFRYSH